MSDNQPIYFVREIIKDYASVVALALSGANKKFKIINKSEVKDSYLLGLTFFSINSYPILKRFRKMFPKNEIIVGGIGVYNSYHRILEYADYVYFGEAFDFKEESVLKKSDIKDKIQIANDIDFNRLPLIKIGQRNYYMQIEKGCPYRCEYCYVSWVNKFCKISDEAFRAKIKFVDRSLKSMHIAFIGNEGVVKERNADLFKQCKNNQYDNQSITLRNYLDNFDLYKGQKIVRFGIELPTEELRRTHLPKIKQLTDNELTTLLTEKYINMVQLFYIWNYVGTTEDDYKRIFEIARHKAPNFLLRLNFTTLEIQPYTKIVDRIEEHINQLLTTPSYSQSEAISKLKAISRIKTYPAKNNDAVLQCYKFTYSNHKLSEPVTSKVLSEIVSNSKLMTKDKDYIYLNQNLLRNFK